MISSPVVQALGYEWQIQVYPRGDTASSTDVEYVCCYLKRPSRAGGRDVTASFLFGLWNFRRYEDEAEADRVSFGNGRRSGFVNFRDCSYRSPNSSLVVLCNIRIFKEDNRVWYPKKLGPAPIDINEDDYLLTFSVEGALYTVRKHVLSRHANRLREMFEEWDDLDEPIPVLSVRGEIFKMLLLFCQDDTPDIEKKDIAKDLLVAADRFECLYVKLYVESVIVDKFLKPENAAAFFVFADSHSCALLKEAAMFVYASDPETVKSASETCWSQISESSKLLEDMCMGRSDEFDQMDVSSLRKELEGANLALDGSREILVHRLSTYRRTVSEMVGSLASVS